MSIKEGCTVTRPGRELIAKQLAAGKPLEIKRVMVGDGVVSSADEARELTALVAPVAAGTSTVPSFDGDTIHMTVEFRSDLNGGLEHGFWLNEFGVFAADGENEVLLFYGTLGDFPQYVSKYTTTGIDVRRFPISIIIGEGAEVIIDYRAEAFMTAEGVAEYCTIVILPMLLEEAQKLIDKHNASREAHPYLLGLFAALEGRVSLLELMLTTNVSENQFTVTFETLDKTNVTGVWNSAGERIEF